MIAALLTLSLAAPLSGGLNSQVPHEVRVPSALQGSDVRASVQLTATHFAARSHAPVRQWIVFENRAAGLRATRDLAPFGELIYPIGGAEAAGDMTVALVTEDGSGLRNASSFEPCASFTGTTLFVERTAQGVDSWISRHGGRSLTRASSAATLHVPVPVPSEDKRRAKRRKIEREKLPPL